MDQTQHMTSPMRVQLVHIAGPRKGDIDEFNLDRIRIGRSPTANVGFPASLRIVSREHAEIVREGNRYLLRNIGKNGCLVNGERIESEYLKQGDVITFAPGGPKVSFLYALDSTERPAPQATAVVYSPETDTGVMTQTLSRSQLLGATSFTVQYGSSVRSFDLAGITLGRSNECDFVIPHHRIMEKHVYLYYADGVCWVHDLSGHNLISVNGTQLYQDAALNPGDTLTFNSNGPVFKYLGEGKLVELKPQTLTPQHSTPPPNPAQEPAVGMRRRGLSGLLKSFFRRH